MNRDELLTRLAMDLAAWPTAHGHIKSIGDGEWRGYNNLAYPDSDGISKHDWLAERERLINKPCWEGAPDEARWLAQDADGCWHWFTREDRDPVVGAAWAWVLPWCKDAFRMLASHGGVPAGHNWKATLEQRPVTQTADPVAEDDACREAERKLREAELLRHITPAELVNRQLVQRCDELQESNARLVDENQRLRRTIGELCA